ncbi:hypothetical protein [Pollutimonas sp. M17]|uniref:hypothetical protein n=1 Tax=Pollutimonas sp. M17 TaxID=2962065 RepID=UPI0021F3FD6B|nr:hypothetical protein [Pollutimonas sp. M17]UYO95006.1 hypothetical protein OEG81_06785 [Pollutimonas sp. M17]
MKSTVQFFAQYCDDVRREADGRASLMGIYPGEIAIPEGVGTVSRIAVQAVVMAASFTDLDLPSVAVSVQLGNNKSLRRLGLPSKMIEDLSREHDGEKAERVIMSFVIELKDISLSNHDSLRTFAHIGEDTIEGPPLHIRRMNKNTHPL